ncbi:general amidase [Trametes versicolor FP-101664 SS1]|uniref:general amidase n=1 Tax=Trametes versicolor (strain FP-101664) TaxID=717944 RepID=UPI000462227B|nr:general amidase [Trametes versicolor FP-101664 SS1]EIW65189.1 general amidase [Trametes versicolor FP-101664 SS1]
MPAQDWKTLCAERKQRQLDLIPKEWTITLPPDSQRNVLDVPRTCGLLSARELDITDTVNVAILLDNLRTGQWSSVEVTTAFYKRAIIAQQLTNCLTEIFIERALARAAEVDEYLKTHGNPIGPLHGLPISLKDQFCIKGMETIMGYAGWIGRVANRDSVLVELLYECGAVPFVRTNVPQTLMWGETYNHVFGRTTNPFNRYMAPGGSSGGEGALVALHGSPLGVGTDIGGSVRIPSAFCGLYGLRPSYERLPYCNAVNAMEGQESISSVLGPMTNSLEGVKLFTKAIIDAKPWRKDPLAVRKEWSAREYALGDHGEGGKMCFAIMWDNGLVKPHPPLVRAMEIAKKALEAAGHTVIDWENHRHLEIFENGQRIFVADDAQDLLNDCALSGEPLIQSMSPETDAHEYALDEPLIRTIVGERRHLSAYELWELHKQKRGLRKSYLDHWEATAANTGTGRPVDAIISPAAAYAACPHGCNSDFFYTELCNFLDYTASILPVTTVDKALDQRVAPHTFHNHEDEAVYKLYDPELWHGMPVNLQLIGRTQEEEGVIGMTEVLDKALKAFKQAEGQ